jgi:GT2 family glycosyltransferase
LDTQKNSTKAKTGDEPAAAELTELRARLDSNRNVLSGILHSNVWRKTASLRRLKYRLRGAVGRLTGLKNPLRVHLETPADGERIRAGLELTGTIDSALPVVMIEVLLDYVVLAQIDPKIKQPTKDDADGKKGHFNFTIPVDAAFAGERLLSVRFRNAIGRIVEIERRITVPGTTPIPQLNQFDQGLVSVRSATDSRASLDLALFLSSGHIFEFAENAAPAVSVILVLYNRAELTLRCLQSLAAHDFRDIELIIVDNDSRDATGELLSRVRGARIIRNSENLHFLKACNAAAALAAGKYILFLNNDAEMCFGAIANAVETLERSPDVGAVGARIILPNGRLQEAGSIIWRDGSTAGFGRGHDPLDLAYAYPRDVDFCSGAFLLTPRELFLGMGSFDVAFAPAYYEEADYCVRLWEKGFRVVYEPRCTVMHYESASSAKRADVDDINLKNRVTFKAHHRDWLARQHRPRAVDDAVAAERLPSGTKRVLMIDTQVPSHSAGAGFPRTIALINMFASLGARLTFFPLQNPCNDLSGAYQDIPREIEICLGGPGTRLSELLADRPGYFDILWVSRPENLAVVDDLLRERPQLFSGTKVIYDCEAIFSLRDIRRAEIAGKPISRDLAEKMIRSELDMALQVDTIVTVSKSEADEILARGNHRVETFGYPIAAAPTEAPFSRRQGLLFLGALHTPDSPNADSLLWFIREVWPLVRRADPSMRLTVVGEIEYRLEKKLSVEGVEITGPVDDPQPYFEAARVFVAPTRFSAGIPLKVLHSAAFGLPVVGTPLLAGQLGWTDEMLTGGSAEDLANACLKLYGDESLWRQTRDKALESVRSACDPAVLLQHLREIIED